MFEVKVDINIGASEELVSVLSKIADSLRVAKCSHTVDNADSVEVVEVVDDANENNHIAIKELRAIVNGAIKHGKRDAVSTLLKEFGVSNISLIPDEARAKFAARIKSL